MILFCLFFPPRVFMGFMMIVFGFSPGFYGVLFGFTRTWFCELLVILVSLGPYYLRPFED